MNPLVLVFGLVAVGYFASSIYRSAQQDRDANKATFRRIVSWLETRANAGKGVKKQPNGAYLVWPTGHIDAVTYDGTFAAYITPVEATSRFRLVAYGYDKASGWKKHAGVQENFSPGEFERQFRQSVFLVGAPAKRHVGTSGSPHHPPGHH